MQLKTVKEAENMLTKPLLMKIDQVTYGCICENPRIFEEEITAVIPNRQEHEPKTRELYRSFKARFDLEVTSRKTRD